MFWIILQVQTLQKVTCRFTVDNFVNGTYHNDISLEVETTNVEWWAEKRVTFCQEPGEEPGDLKVWGTKSREEETCSWSGLLLRCTATDTSNPWHDFKSNTQVV